MLSEETAGGEHPVRAVEVMAAIARETEGSVLPDTPSLSAMELPLTEEEAVVQAACQFGARPRSDVIVTITATGDTARFAAKCRNRQPTIAQIRETPGARIRNMIRLGRPTSTRLYSQRRREGPSRVMFTLRGSCQRRQDRSLAAYPVQTLESNDFVDPFLKRVAISTTELAQAAHLVGGGIRHDSGTLGPDRPRWRVLAKGGPS